jgi:hypothetical protein
MVYKVCYRILKPLSYLCCYSLAMHLVLAPRPHVYTQTHPVRVILHQYEHNLAHAKLRQMALVYGNRIMMQRKIVKMGLCFEKDGRRISIDSRIDVSRKFPTLLHFEFLCQKNVKHTKPNHQDHDDHGF